MCWSKYRPNRVKPLEKRSTPMGQQPLQKFSDKKKNRYLIIKHKRVQRIKLFFFSQFRNTISLAMTVFKTQNVIEE